MKPSVLTLSLLMVCLATMSVPVLAQNIVYENGPINGQELGWTINFGYIEGDTFTVANSSSNINGVSFGAWLFPGDVLTSAEVWINSTAGLGGTTYFDQVVNFTASNCFLNGQAFNICTETATFDGPTLDRGTYWLSLGNAIVPSGDPVYWDNNGGAGCHSFGCPSQTWENGDGSIPSEAFSVLGSGTSTGTTPEPGSVLLFSSAFLAAAGVMRRKLF
jgi:hypothetical protein